MAVIFIDLEASSLAVWSHPIEISWIGESGQGESHLIRPEPDWMDWSGASETVHGISREEIQRDGTPAAIVAGRALQALGNPADTVVSDAPAFDQAWLDKLLLAGGHGRRIAVRDVTDIYVDACRPMVEWMATDEAARAVTQLVEAAKQAEMARARRRHRALEDATGLWWTWRWIVRHVADVG
jgi:hypothetical protein